MGFGIGPFGLGSFGNLPGPPDGGQVQGSLSSSRKIDPETKRYVLNDDGSFAAMDDVKQRVLLLISFAIVDTPIITDNDLSAQQARLRAALAPLTKSSPPAIELLGVVVERSGPGEVSRSVTYLNLLTNTQQTVTA